MPLKVSVPVPVKPVMTTPARLSAGVSSGSEKPKAEAPMGVAGASSSSVNVLSRPCGSSLTAFTLKVKVRTVGSVSAPLLAMPPSSTTWKPKLA